MKDIEVFFISILKKRTEMIFREKIPNFHTIQLGLREENIGCSEGPSV